MVTVMTKCDIHNVYTNIKIIIIYSLLGTINVYISIINIKIYPGDQ